MAFTRIVLSGDPRKIGALILKGLSGLSKAAMTIAQTVLSFKVAYLDLEGARNIMPYVTSTMFISTTARVSADLLLNKKQRAFANAFAFIGFYMLLLAQEIEDNQQSSLFYGIGLMLFSLLSSSLNETCIRQSSRRVPWCLRYQEGGGEIIMTSTDAIFDFASAVIFTSLILNESDGIFQAKVKRRGFAPATCYSVNSFLSVLMAYYNLKFFAREIDVVEELNAEPQIELEGHLGNGPEGQRQENLPEPPPEEGYAELPNEEEALNPGEQVPLADDQRRENDDEPGNPDSEIQIRLAG